MALFDRLASLASRFVSPQKGIVENTAPAPDNGYRQGPVYYGRPPGAGSGDNQKKAPFATGATPLRSPHN
jgi:hypothetical protein